MQNSAKQKAQLELVPGFYNGELIVKIYFDYNPKIIDAIKTIPGRRWNEENRFWYLPKRQFNLVAFLSKINSMAEVNYSALEAFDEGSHYGPKGKEHPPPREEKNPGVESRLSELKPNVELPAQYYEILIRKRYSPNTIKTYICYMKSFLEEFHDRKLESISTQQINDYILKLIRTKGISPSQQNQRINAIKFYYEKVLGRDKLVLSIERPRRARELPRVLSEEEVVSILKSIDNLKHKSIISTIYSAGLRRSELINLRKQDVLYDRKIIFIRGSKGKKDRNTILSDLQAILLQKYLLEYKPNYWLFEGNNRNQYSATSIAKILKRAAAKAGVDKRVTPHMLRHSFATHLLEHGVDIRYIQEILGHDSSKTTEIYTHISTNAFEKIRSPLDVIFKKV